MERYGNYYDNSKYLVQGNSDVVPASAIRRLNSSIGYGKVEGT